MNRRGLLTFLASVPVIGAFVPDPAPAASQKPTALWAVRDLLLPGLRSERSPEYGVLGDRRIIEADIIVDHRNDCLHIKAYTENRMATWTIDRDDIQSRRYKTDFRPMNRLMGAWLIESDSPADWYMDKGHPGVSA